MSRKNKNHTLQISNSTAQYYSVVRQEGSREVCRTVKHYNLDAIALYETQNSLSLHPNL